MEKYTVMASREGKSTFYDFLFLEIYGTLKIPQKGINTILACFQN